MESSSRRGLGRCTVMWPQASHRGTSAVRYCRGVQTRPRGESRAQAGGPGPPLPGTPGRAAQREGGRESRPREACLTWRLLHPLPVKASSPRRLTPPRQPRSSPRPLSSPSWRLVLCAVWRFVGEPFCPSSTRLPSYPLVYRGMYLLIKSFLWKVLPMSPFPH